MMRMIAMMLGVLVLGAGIGHASDPADTVARKLVNQTRCPVMGGKIDSAAYTDIQGQRVYHCCPGCSAKLRKDPNSYFQKAAAEGILFENVQTVCPVSGKPINKAHVLDFEGRRVYVCSDTCANVFRKHPGRYLEALDKGMPKPDKKESKAKADEHSEHGRHGGH